jgi:serine/threonine protein kinase
MSTTATPALFGPDFTRRYTLGPILRSTPFTQVWAAHDLKLDRDVTITVAHEQLGRDAAALRIVAASTAAVGELSHPGIARVYDAGTVTHNGHPLPWAAGEPITGPNIDQFVRPSGITDDQWATEILTIAEQVAAALQHAHASGILHGNLSPATVLLTGPNPHQPAVKIVDFGPQPADLAYPTDPALTVTMWERFTRSLEYPSPEQSKGLAPTRRSDIFGFGCIIAVLLLEIPEPSTVAPQATFPTLAHELRSIAKKAMKKHPTDRQHSFLAIQEQLRNLHAGRLRRESA